RARVEPLVVYRRGLLGGRLQVTPPDACGPELIADGVEPKPPQGIGERAWWLSQMVGMVPPGLWPVEAAGAASRGGWTAAVLRGWAAATGRYRDLAWAEALVLLWARTPARRRDELGFAPEPVVLDLEPRDRDALLARLVHASPPDG